MSPRRRHTAGCVLAGAHRRVAARRDPTRRRRQRRLFTKEERRERRAGAFVAARGGDRRRLRDARRVRRRGASHGARGVRGGAPRLVRATKCAYDRGTREPSGRALVGGERHRGEARRRSTRRNAGSRRVPCPSRFFGFAREPEDPRNAPLYADDLRRGHRGRVAVPEPGRRSAAAGRAVEFKRERVQRIRRVFVRSQISLDGCLVDRRSRRASNASTDGSDEAPETHPADVHETLSRRRGSKSAYRRGTRRRAR